MCFVDNEKAYEPMIVNNTVLFKIKLQTNSLIEAVKSPKFRQVVKNRDNH